MATAPQVRDHGPLVEIFQQLGDLLDGFDKHARTYATTYWLAVQEGRKGANPPANLHPDMAKAVREIVLDVATMQRLARTRS